MAFIDLSSEFRQAVPFRINVTVEHGHVFGMLFGQRYDLAEFLPFIAENYLHHTSFEIGGQDLFWEYSIGAPARIGGTFCFRAVTQKFRAWLWTELPEVELPSFKSAARGAAEFLRLPN